VTPAPGHDLSGAPETLEPMERAVWTVRPSDEQRVSRLAVEARIPRVLAALLLARGVSTGEEARGFLTPADAAFFDPSLMKGIDEAADLLVTTARAGRRIVVFGDYDVDGVTSVAQLRAALARVGGDSVAFLPHRLRDGYGFRPATVRRVIDELRPQVIVTVDCGITAVEGVACARARGVEVVVTDHHLVPEMLPPGAVVVNPRQPGCGYPDKELAACGIAWKLSLAVARKAGVSLSAGALLRAAGLGTIADLVPLTGENRAIAAGGLARLADARAPGLKALLAEAGVAPGQAPTSEQVAFRIAPRLNAAGRLDTAELALSLFEERDASRAGAIARELSRRNAQRQAVERVVTAQARDRIRSGGCAGRDAVLVLADAGWHRGVLGIAASRLAREYHRPVLLFALEGGRAVGSGRSIPGVPMHDMLKTIGHLFEEFGGHDQAVGGSLAESRFEELAEAARALFAQRVPAEALVRREEAELELPFERADGELAHWLQRLEPHGMGNPRPVFRASAVRSAGPCRSLGESGIRGRLESPGGALDFVCWSADEHAPLLTGGGRLDVHYRLRPGWRGGLEAEVAAVRPAQA
jgi:single-stranded-DNA-specific exonuclease